MLLFSDNTEFVSATAKINDVFGMGGFMIDISSTKKVEHIINSIKANHGIPAQLPIKWNFKDSKLQKIYTDALGTNKYNELVKDTDLIRNEIFSEISNVDMLFIISCMRQLGSTDKTDIVSMLFRNLLERYGIEIKSRSNSDPVNFIVLDWEEELRDELCGVFEDAYQKGDGFYSGKFEDIGLSLPYLSFSVTVHNPLLQVADLVVGCTTDFIKCVLTEKTQRGNIQSMFKLILPNFRKSNIGEIIDWGLIIRPNEDKIKIKEAISKLENS